MTSATWRDGPSAEPFFKVDVADHVPGIFPRRLLRTAWGLEPGLAGTVHEQALCIDLRSQSEKTAEEIEIGRRRIIDIPVQQPGGAYLLGNAPGRAEYTRNYQGMVDSCGPALARAVETVARSLPIAVVVGCSMGRDRTGVVIGLILAAVGVGFDQIVESERSVRGAIARAVADAPFPDQEMTREQVIYRLGVAHDSLGDCLVHCAASRGSVHGYLLGAGVSRAALAKLRAGLTPSSCAR